MRRSLLEALPRLRRFAVALTGSRQDADDVVQITVERLLRHGVPISAKVDHWAFRVCRNAWIDEVRARAIRASEPLTSTTEGFAAHDGEQVVLGRLRFAEVQAAMMRLPEEQRAALSLVSIEGLSYAQTARVLDTPIGTVMSRVARARRTLSGLFTNTAWAPANAEDKATS